MYVLYLHVAFLQEGSSTSQADDDDLEDDKSASNQPLRTTFELNDTLYAEAELEDTDTVHLWLGVSLFDLAALNSQVHLTQICL
jgi:hypothetical protein